MHLMRYIIFLSLVILFSFVANLYLYRLVITSLLHRTMKIFFYQVGWKFLLLQDRLNIVLNLLRFFFSYNSNCVNKIEL